MSWWREDAPLSELVGQTLKSVVESGDEIRFETEEGRKYLMHHEQDCCENVRIEEITGDLQSLVGSPILLAEESSNQELDGDYGDTATWTFYKLATVKGHVDIRWYGTSNGYYSERVDFVRDDDEP